MINLQVKVLQVNLQVKVLQVNLQVNASLGPREAFFPWSDIGEVSLQPTGLLLALTEPVLYLVNYPTNNAWNATTLRQ